MNLEECALFAIDNITEKSVTGLCQANKQHEQQSYQFSRW